ncbi:hypothetical protein Syun_007499 [Stephania yunnanensis]|uniref:Uncharacterized protein n=1 Tax=Stephania yunnanensis TaxID=152371 RepID=A0AAP0KYL3_9MAGN
MNPNESKRKSFENKEVEERNRVNSRRRQLYAQLSREEKDRRNYVRRVSYRQKRSLQCMEKGSSSNHDGCISDDTIIDGLQKECMVEGNIGTAVSDQMLDNHNAKRLDETSINLGGNFIIHRGKKERKNSDSGRCDSYTPMMDIFDEVVMVSLMKYVIRHMQELTLEVDVVLERLKQNRDMLFTEVKRLNFLLYSPLPLITNWDLSNWDLSHVRQSDGDLMRSVFLSFVMLVAASKLSRIRRPNDRKYSNRYKFFLFLRQLKPKKTTNAA